MSLLGWRDWLPIGVCCVGVMGCGEKSPINKHVRDPLLISKKPMEGKPDRPAPVQLAAAEPSPPPIPETAVATAPVKLEAIGVGVERATGPANANPPEPRLKATPVSRTGTSPAVPAETVSRREPAGIYGHAPDHSWLQGVIDKHYHGHLNLRYCDHSEEDQWGGKVILSDDPRLAEFKDGDVVRVEGEVIHEEGKAKRATWNHFVQYRVKEIRWIQSK